METDNAEEETTNNVTPPPNELVVEEGKDIQVEESLTAPVECMVSMKAEKAVLEADNAEEETSFDFGMLIVEMKIVQVDLQVEESATTSAASAPSMHIDKVAQVAKKIQELKMRPPMMSQPQLMRL